MARSFDYLLAHTEAALSTVAHRFPGNRLVQKMEAKVTGLGRPDDIHLRWRVGSWLGRERDWQLIPGTEGAKQRDPSTWAAGIIAVQREVMEARFDLANGRIAAGLPAASRRMAVAYRMAPQVTNSIIMVGVNERQPGTDLLRPITPAGRPDKDGELLAVIARTGAYPNCIAIGTVGADPAAIELMPTQFVPVEAIPPGIYRV